MELNVKLEELSDNIDFLQEILDDNYEHQKLNDFALSLKKKKIMRFNCIFSFFSRREKEYRAFIKSMKSLLDKSLYKEALDLLSDKYPSLTYLESKKALKLFTGKRARLLLLSNIFDSVGGARCKQKGTGKVLYFLFNSYPYANNGYAIRSHGISKALVNKGIELEVVTRAGYPFDVKQSFHQKNLTDQIIEGVTYSRVIWPKREQSFHNYRSYKTEEYLWLSVLSYKAVLERKRPKVVIAASNYITALPLYLAAKSLSIPFIYDIRGFWELTESSRNENYKNSESYKIDRFIELELIKNSDYVFSISKILQEEIQKQTGINSEKARVLYNGSDERKYTRIQKNKEGLVLGFIGSLNDYEGLEDLLMSLPSLLKEGADISLKIIGSEALSLKNKKGYACTLFNLVHTLNLQNRVTFIDKVKMEELDKYYRGIDLIVIPRRDWDVCNLITPLKLIEAMSFSKAVLASDVDAIKENIVDGYNGFLFKKGDIKSLTMKLRDIYFNKNRIFEVSRNSHQWFLKNRTWDYVTNDIANIINNIDSSRIKEVSDNTSLMEEVAVYENNILHYKNNPEGEVSLSTIDRLKVVFILHSSMPYLSGGYATRAHGLIKGIEQAGVNVFPYTRPGFPHDLKKKNLKLRFSSVDFIDGIVYRRIESTINRLEYDEKYFMWKSINEYRKIFLKERPDIVHGRSTYLISLPAYVAAVSLGIPFVYEVSGLWELVFESRADADKNFLKIQRIRALETLVMQGADQILTLTSDMRDEIVSRGISPENVTLIPNSVDINKFYKVDKNYSLQKEVGIEDKDFVFGYIGSFVEYEGLDDLIYAFNNVAGVMPNAKLLLVGSGNVKEKIVAAAKNTDYSQRIIVLDRIPHDEVVNYYSLLDIVVFARKGWDVCEKVSPMKPFEAMACEKVVLASSVKALKDIVSDGIGFIFEKDSIDDLSKNLKQLYSKRDQLPTIGKLARNWVVNNRSWNIAGNNVKNVYDIVIANRENNGSL